MTLLQARRRALQMMVHQLLTLLFFAQLFSFFWLKRTIQGKSHKRILCSIIVLLYGLPWRRLDGVHRQGTKNASTELCFSNGLPGKQLEPNSQVCNQAQEKAMYLNIFKCTFTESQYTVIVTQKKCNVPNTIQIVMYCKGNYDYG